MKDGAKGKEHQVNEGEDPRGQIVALSNQSMTLQSILDSMGDGVVVVDEKGKFLLSNPAVEQILGFSLDEEDATGEDRGERYGVYLPDKVTPCPPDALPLTLATSGRPVDGSELFIRNAKAPQGIWLSSTARPLTDADGVLRGGVAVFRDITRRKNAEEELQRSREAQRELAERNAVLADIGKILSGALDIDEVYEEFAEKVHSLVPFHRISVTIADQELGTVTSAYVSVVAEDGKIQRQQGQTYPLADSVTEMRMRTRSGMVIQSEDIAELLREHPHLESVVPVGMMSYVIVPLISNDGPIGALSLGSAEADAYSRNELFLAEQVAGETAGAIASARLYAQVKRAEEEQRNLAEENAVISEIGRIIGSSLDIDEVYERFALEMRKVVDFDRVNIDIIDGEKDLVTIKYLYGEGTPGYGVGATFPIPGVGDRVRDLMSGNILINDAASGPISSADLNYMEAGLLSSALVPLIAKGRVIGILVLRSRRADAYGPRERALLERLTNLIAPAVENARLYEQTLQAERELAQRAEELARSNEELERFAHVASHDLQEPLRMVTSYVQILAEDYKGKLDSDADRYINYAVNGADRMIMLINDLLAFSRVGTQGSPLEPTDFNRVMEQVLVNLSVTINDTRARVTYEDLPTVKGDPTQLTQLLQNLVSNAIKFRGDDRPEVHVSVERNVKESVFSVQDNGIGIAPRHQERIFVMFQRLHSSSEYPGTGIGLALCQKIVQRHGGRIWVESEPGTGSTFYFTMPVEVTVQT